MQISQGLSVSPNSFIIKCFKPFSAQIDTVGVYSKLYVETSNYHKDLAVQVQNREKKLNTGINPMTQRKIKLQERQLKLTILHAAKMLQDFYPKKIFPRKALFSEEDFWEDEQLKFRDWRDSNPTTQQKQTSTHMPYNDMCCEHSLDSNPTSQQKQTSTHFVYNSFYIQTSHYSISPLFLD
ncbi:unnamed protein product [Mytilus edulis]|uniref:Uncharacterized protein n=1 Tax=Mytilus edulis TaxID=6550 RepID=A0A8S3TRZ6_MYTED|nr:unnamed protein product [Mytilus edulis]